MSSNQHENTHGEHDATTTISVDKCKEGVCSTRSWSHLPPDLNTPPLWTLTPPTRQGSCTLSGVCDFLRGKQKQTSEDRRPTAIAWRRRLRGPLHLHHPLRLDHSSVLRVSRADLPTLPHHQPILFHTEFFLGLLPATTQLSFPFREERDRRLSVCPALGRARTRG